MKEAAIIEQNTRNDYVNQVEKQVPDEGILVFELKNMRPGHRIFELNLDTSEIKPAEVKQQVVMGKIMRNKHHTHYRDFVEIISNKNCLYCPALNAENAEKRFNKLIKAKVNALRTA